MKFKFSVESEDDARLACRFLQAFLGRVAMPLEIQQGAPIKPTYEYEYEHTAVAADEAPAKKAEPAVIQPKAEPKATVAIAEPADPSPYTKEQIKNAAGVNPELAALISKRGRKSAEESARIVALTRATIDGSAFGEKPVPTTTAAPVGAALQGATAEELNAALKADTTVVESQPGVEVRTVPAAATAAASQPNGALDFLNKKGAMSAASAGQSVAQPAPAQPAAESPADLFKRIQAYADDGAGLFWFRNVVSMGGGDIQNLTPEFMQGVLANPEAYYPSH